MFAWLDQNRPNLDGEVINYTSRALLVYAFLTIGGKAASSLPYDEVHGAFENALQEIWDGDYKLRSRLSQKTKSLWTQFEKWASEV